MQCFSENLEDINNKKNLCRVLIYSNILQLITLIHSKATQAIHTHVGKQDINLIEGDME